MNKQAWCPILQGRVVWAMTGGACYGVSLRPGVIFKMPMGFVF